jgi:hypothetical protein
MLVQIVPRLPPAIDGLGDYALNIARQLHGRFGVESRFIVGDSSWNGGDEIEKFPAARLAKRSSTALLSDLMNFKPPYAVLLHYVGYGYARRGAPAWLVDGLELWRARYHDAFLLTMFHEIYATGPFWTSSFWLSSLQKRVAARLVQLSDTCLTSRQSYAEILHELSRNKHRSIATLPVFSNIGEPEEPPLALKDRKRRLVVFGNSRSRLRVYEKSLSSLERVCRALNIEEIFDIGPPIESSIISRVGSVPVVRMGQRPAAEVSSILSDSIVGFFDYNHAFLAKSTIFAAYCAHRLILVSAPCQSAQVNEDGLEVGKHYWIADASAKNLDLFTGQAIADNAYAWYLNHNLLVHTETYFTKVKSEAFRES